jgi:manganese/iron transport system permease protein
LIIPGATGFLISKDFKRMLLIATLSTVTAAVLGVYTSYYIDSSPAPTIVLFMTMNFLLAYILFSTKKTLKVTNKTKN